jgi:hypothetical protein
MSRQRIFIVKVQLPIVTSEPAPMALIYNRDRSVGNMVPVTAKLRRLVRDELKSFWFAHLIPDPNQLGAFLVSLARPAPWQEW